MSNLDSAATALEKGFCEDSNFPEPQQLLSELSELLTVLEGRQPETIVEVGTARGGTFCILSAIPSVNIAISIDLPGVAATENELQSVADAPTIRAIRQDSQTVQTKEKVEDILDGRDIDALLIDADHHYDSVMTDYELYAPLVGSNGIVFVHDIVVHDRADEIEVDEFWTDLEADGTKAEIVDQAYGPPFVKRDGWNIVAHGFGVVDRRGELKGRTHV